MNPVRYLGFKTTAAGINFSVSKKVPVAAVKQVIRAAVEQRH
jgi:hypothetical protein